MSNSEKSLSASSLDRPSMSTTSTDSSFDSINPRLWSLGAALDLSNAGGQEGHEHSERCSVQSEGSMQESLSGFHQTGPVLDRTSTGSNAHGTSMYKCSADNVSDSNGSISSKSSRLVPAVGGKRLLNANSLTTQYFTSKKKLELIQVPDGPTPHSSGDGQNGESTEVPERTTIRTHQYVNGATLAVLCAFGCWAFYIFISKAITIKAYYALGVIWIVPMGIFFFSFAAKCAVSGLFSLFHGGTKCLHQNSQHYSALKTPIPKGTTKLPQIVVQMPVYKESLDEVIRLSYFNVKKAMDYYESRGGRVKYIICDDGFQVISCKEAVARSNFYSDHNIAFVGRPAEKRRGIFKKASNMNYQLAISDRVSQIMKERPGTTAEEALVAVWDEREREFAAAGDLTMDDDCLILLIDADTKVPEKCMYDVVGEFLQDSTVAYTQHYTTAFDEQSRNYWEQHISAFTRLIYFQGIAVYVAFGDCAPLVGHNAFLRWSAVRTVGYTDTYCRPSEIKYWSEESVSEDFDLYVRLSTQNAFGRYVMYTGAEFQEGVSLSYMDEVIKLKKFAYGACEIIFNPLKLWPMHGPFTRMFRLYLANKHISWSQKVSMLTYLSTYFAMAAAFWFCIFEGVMSIIDPKFHDYFIVRSFDVMLTCVLIFAGINTACSGIFYNWRRTAATSGKNIFSLLWDQLKWIPITTLFFNSVLFHLTIACFYYFFSIPVVWGATAKESTVKTCWQAMKETFWGYRFEYATYTIILAAYCV